ncbi:MAG: hypothetical protein PHO14_05375 [Kiritimatiellae bacterium]|nr:hypothetical protein [Kiritimatiellia bacterium]
MTAACGIRDKYICQGVSLAFYLYALLAAPPLARALKAALADAQPVYWPGVLLLAVLLLEPFGLRWKLQFLRRRNDDDGFRPEGAMVAFGSATAIAHMIVTVILGMLALDAWGAVGIGAHDAGTWWGIVIVALILKEFVGLFVAGGQSRAREAPGHVKEHLSDLFLLAYGCVAYTAWWEAIVDIEALSNIGGWEKLVLLPVLAGLFLFLYLPMRLPFLLEEFYRRPAAGRKTRIGLELAIGAALGLYPAFF